MRITDNEITLRLRSLTTAHLNKLLKLYPNDTRALPLIKAEIRRQRQKGVRA